MSSRASLRTMLACLAATALAVVAGAQPAPERPRFSPPTGPQVTSPEVHEDGRVSFRILAPKAESVRLGGTDIPNNGQGGPNQGTPLIRGSEGVWELSLDSVPPGAYRYNFNVDGVSVIDPRNPATSESNQNTWSLVYLPGADFMETKDVPRGSVAEVTYYSKALKRFRRMHVYTPPGYESGEGRFPVFYLLHGALDCDDSWTTVGRAGFILDNLIAAGKAKPMVVAMPAGHTGPFRFGMPLPTVDEFAADFTGDVMPWVESHYRVHTDRAHRAMAGLSMGGGQTLNVGIADLERFGYLGVFSSGVFGITGDFPGVRPGPSWEEQHAEALNAAAAKQGLELVWFSTGTDDFLIETSRATVAMLRKNGFDVVYEESDGGHTWKNWRDYLVAFTPLLFR